MDGSVKLIIDLIMKSICFFVCLIDLSEKYRNEMRVNEESTRNLILKSIVWRLKFSENTKRRRHHKTTCRRRSEKNCLNSRRKSDRKAWSAKTLKRRFTRSSPNKSRNCRKCLKPSVLNDRIEKKNSWIYSKRFTPKPPNP